MTNAIPERSISFNDAMVEAILAGRKTVTRRLLKPQPVRWRLGADDREMGARKGDWVELGLERYEDEVWPRVRLGRVVTSQQVKFRAGMHLWVREAFARLTDPSTVEMAGGEVLAYRSADNCVRYGGPWTPSVHMRRGDSRITLEVTEEPRLEMLQDITESEARAEG